MTIAGSPMRGGGKCECAGGNAVEQTTLARGWDPARQLEKFGKRGADLHLPAPLTKQVSWPAATDLGFANARSRLFERTMISAPSNPEIAKPDDYAAR